MLTLTFADAETPPPGAGREIDEWLDESGQPYAQTFSSDDLHWINWLDVGVFAFAANSMEVRVWPEPGISRQAIIDTFLFLQPVILQAVGWQALHAGAAASPAGALAFCGNSGSGKSTLAFAMQQAGWRQLADDALVLRFDQNGVTACPLPFTPRLRPPSRAYFARSPLPSPGLLSEVPLIAVFLLKHETELTNPRVSLIPRAQAFSKVLTHAHCFDVGDLSRTGQLAESYLRLAARVPVLMLEYRPDLERLPHLVRAVVETVADIDADPAFPSELVTAALVP
jgi:hypothetical protein